jgi:hypothetical protein
MALQYFKTEKDPSLQEQALFTEYILFHEDTSPRKRRCSPAAEGDGRAPFHYLRMMIDFMFN